MQQEQMPVNNDSSSDAASDETDTAHGGSVVIIRIIASGLFLLITAWDTYKLRNTETVAKYIATREGLYRRRLYPSIVSMARNLMVLMLFHSSGASLDGMNT